MPEVTAPIRVAIVNDFEVVVRGVRDMLTGLPGFEVVEVELGSSPDVEVDVTLFDTFAARVDGRRLEELVADPFSGRVVVYSWAPDAEQSRLALAGGASGVLSKALSAHELASAIRGVMAGEKVVRPEPKPPQEEGATRALRHVRWPGKDEGLTAREAEVLGLIAKGLTNEEISQALFLSINSVKSYIRSAYRKIGAERRSQAVLWALDRGIARSVVPARGLTANE